LSLKDTDVKTPGNAAIAKKFKLSLARVRQLVADGAKHEKEHNTDQAKAEEVARDHISERPDYYKMLNKAVKTKVQMKEESSTGGVRGLGFVTGDPGVNYVDQYINTNSMAYVDENGNKLKNIKKKHIDLHNSKLGYNFFDPTNIKELSNKTLKEFNMALGPDADLAGTSDAPSKTYRKTEVKEDAFNEDLRKWFREKWVRYDTKGNIKGPCAREEGEGKPKCRPLASARAMSKDERAKSARRKRREDPVADRPGKGGKPIMVNTNEETLLEKNVPTNPELWARAKSQAKAKFDVYPSAYANGWASKWYKSKGGGWKSAANESVDEACWDNYKQKGMKKKGNKMVPNCVPVEEQGQVYSRYTERPMYEMIDQNTHDRRIKKLRTDVLEDWQSVNRKDKTDGLSQKAVNAYKRENPGSKLQTAVTEKNPTGKRASRRKSFCSRMGGMKKRLTSAKTARDPDSRINKALRRWNCEEERTTKGASLPQVGGIDLGVVRENRLDELKAETLGSYLKKAVTSRKKSLEGSKPDIKTWAKRQKGVTTAIKKLTSVDKPKKDVKEFWMPFIQQHHKHSARLSKKLGNKPDLIMDRGGEKGQTKYGQQFKEETKMDNNNLINEAIENILENDLAAMKENFMASLQEKAIEKLEERKKQIASEYFAQ